MIQQTTAPESRISEENVKTAMEDIALIKHIVNHSEINLRRLGWLFLVYGCATLAFLAFDNILTFFTARTASLQSTANLSIVLMALSYAVSIALFVLFVRKRRSIKKSENVYTMKLFDLWGVMMFVPTALELAIYLAAVFAADNLPEITFVLLRIVFNAMKNTALYMCIFFTGHYIGSRFLKIVSAVLMILMILLFTCGISLSGTGMSENNYFSQLNGMISTRISIATYIQIAVYLVMGIYCIVKQRGSTHGDQ